MREDNHGLYCEGKLLTEVARAREAHVLLKHGAIEGLSIGYDCKVSEMEDGDGASCPPGPYGMPFYGGGPRVRRLKEIELWEVSIVTFPMNADAEIDRVKRGSEHAAPRLAIRSELASLAGAIAARGRALGR
jgi:phage head maturation protease